MSKIHLIDNYGVAPNSLLNDYNISLKAKGLFVFMQSKPADWVFSIEKIAYQNRDGIDSVRNAINELIEKGYLIKKRASDGHGKTFSVYNIVYMTLDNPTLENPIMGKPNIGKSNDIVIKKEAIKKEIEKRIIDERFEKFWKTYQKEIQKDKCYQAWKIINTIDKDKILEILPNYIISTPDIQYRKNPLTYLNNKSWLDEVFVFKSPSSFSEAKSNTRPPNAIITVPDNY